MKLPTHETIARHAEKIWQDSGRPSGRDREIWLEAEQQLIALSSKPSSTTTAHEHAPTLGEGHSDHALAEKAATQRHEALAAKRPTKTAPKLQPPETGKPLWSKPHSR